MLTATERPSRRCYAQALQVNLLRRVGWDDASIAAIPADSAALGDPALDALLELVREAVPRGRPRLRERRVGAPPWRGLVRARELGDALLSMSLGVPSSISSSPTSRTPTLDVPTAPAHQDPHGQT